MTRRHQFTFEPLVKSFTKVEPERIPLKEQLAHEQDEKAENKRKYLPGQRLLKALNKKQKNKTIDDILDSLQLDEDEDEE